MSKTNVVDESYYIKDEGKWYFSHGTMKQTWYLKKKNISINANRITIATDRTKTIPFKKSEEMGLMVQMLRDFTSDFNDDFWEAYNYIPLDEVFERALINAKIP